MVFQFHTLQHVSLRYKHTHTAILTCSGSLKTERKTGRGLLNGRKSKECEITHCATPPLYLCLWPLKIRFTIMLSATGGIRVQQPRLVCLSFYLRREMCVWDSGSWGSPGSSQRTTCSRTGRLKFFFFSFCTCSTIEHCTWAPYFTSCQSVKGSERWRKKTKTCIYDAVTLRGLTYGSGFAAVSIAGITQTRIRGFGRGETKCACKLSSDKYTEKNPHLCYLGLKCVDTL